MKAATMQTTASAITTRTLPLSDIEISPIVIIYRKIIILIVEFPRGVVIRQRYTPLGKTEPRSSFPSQRILFPLAEDKPEYNDRTL